MRTKTRLLTSAVGITISVYFIINALIGLAVYGLVDYFGFAFLLFAYLNYRSIKHAWKNLPDTEDKPPPPKPY